MPTAADLPSGAERGGCSPGRWAADWTPQFSSGISGLVLLSEAFLGFGSHHAARLPSLCFLSFSLLTPFGMVRMCEYGLTLAEYTEWELGPHSLLPTSSARAPPPPHLFKPPPHPRLSPPCPVFHQLVLVRGLAHSSWRGFLVKV